MVDNLYGRVFKKIREQKGLPMSFFQKVGVRKSSISKFENGTSKMSFERIYQMLELMDVSLEEYELIINQFNPNFQDYFFIELEKAVICQDSKRLEKLYNEVNGTSNILLSLIVKSKITLLGNDEIDKILNRLFTAKYWGYLELVLLESVTEGLNLKYCHKIFDILKDKVYKYKDNFKYTRKLNQIIHLFALTLIARGEKDFAQKILDKIQIDNQIDFYIFNYHNLVVGVKNYCFNNKEIAKQEIKEGLMMMKKLGGENLYSYHRNKVDYFLKKFDHYSNLCYEIDE